MPEASAQTVLRVKPQAYVARAAGSFFVAFSAGLTFFAGSTLLAATFTYGPILALAAWVLVRTGWTAVVICPGHLRIRNVTKTVDVPWASIDRFEMGRRGRSPNTVWLVRTDGEVLGMNAMDGPDPGLFPRSTAVADNHRRLCQALRAHETRARMALRRRPKS